MDFKISAFLDIEPPPRNNFPAMETTIERKLSPENVKDALYYYRARYLRPDLGRFVAMDPLGMVDGTNQFVYVQNDPVGFVDPTGLDTWSGACFGGTFFATKFGIQGYTCGLQNWSTGEICWVTIYSYKMQGWGVMAGIDLNSLWIFDGPSCGEDLEGGFSGCGGGAGSGLYGAGGSGSWGDDGSKSFSLGAGGGYGGGTYGLTGKMNVRGCGGTPEKCDCEF